MNWEAVGALGDFVSAIAVLLTLIYLSIQVRMSNRFEAAKHFDVHMDRVRAFDLEIARDGDLARIWDLGSEGRELTPEDQVRWQVITKYKILIQRDGWMRGRLIGTLPGLAPYEFYLDILVYHLEEKPGYRQYWDSKVQELGRDEFVDYVNSRLSHKKLQEGA